MKCNTHSNCFVWTVNRLISTVLVASMWTLDLGCGYHVTGGHSLLSPNSQFSAHATARLRAENPARITIVIKDSSGDTIRKIVLTLSGRARPFFNSWRDEFQVVRTGVEYVDFLVRDQKVVRIYVANNGMSSATESESEAM